VYVTSTFIVGQEKQINSDKMRLVNAREWSQSYDSAEKKMVGKTRFVLLKFFGQNLDTSRNYNIGDTIMVSGELEDSIYMAQCRDGESSPANVAQGYTPKVSFTLNVDRIHQIQFSKDTSEKLGVQNGGWGRSQGSNASSRSGSYAPRTNANTSQQRGNARNQAADPLEDDFPQPTNNRNQQSRPVVDQPQVVSEDDYSDLELPISH